MTTEKTMDRPVPHTSTLVFQNGVECEFADLAADGTKITITHPECKPLERELAILLPPDLVEQLYRWLAGTHGRIVRKLPHRLPQVLKRLSTAHNVSKVLERGERTVLKNAVNVFTVEEWL